MGKISDTSKYATVTPASGDYMVATDVSDSNNTKTVTIGSMADAMLSGVPSATLASDDKLIGLDTSDSNNVKQFTLSGVRGGYVKKMEASSSGDQTDAGTNTAQQVTFGAEQILTDVSVAADGTIKLITTGDYFISADFQVGTVSSTASTIHLRVLVNGTQVGATISEVLPATTAETPICWSFPVYATTANTTVIFQYAVEPTGNGGLVEVPVTTSGFNNSSAAAVVIYKKE